MCGSLNGNGRDPSPPSFAHVGRKQMRGFDSERTNEFPSELCTNVDFQRDLHNIQTCVHCDLFVELFDFCYFCLDDFIMDNVHIFAFTCECLRTQAGGRTDAMRSSVAASNCAPSAWAI